ncbi:lysozyme [Scytonema sp. NUACC26]|uniref:lysozyme n=1 Tax=Scytonema sp. NUACC26 TaxID=3140176 RepID=UPI0038B2E849
MFESCFLSAYPDPLSGNLPITIGFGATVKLNGQPWKLGDRITQDEAEHLLNHQLSTSYLPTIAATVPFWNEMNDNQRGALLSFCYNLGQFMKGGNFDTLRSALHEKRWSDIPKILLMYRNPDSRVELGLKRRRYTEGLVWTGVNVQIAFSRAQREVAI